MRNMSNRIMSAIMAVVISASCTVLAFATAVSIRINISQVTIQSGGQYQLSAIVSPSDAARNVQWSSSNPNVASVSSTGLVSGKNSGTATITCRTTDGSNLSASCTVTVAQLISSISLSASHIEINTGSSQKISVSVSPSSATNQVLKWSSSNAGIASVDGNGNVIGVSPGTATVTCITTDGSKKSASCVVTVKQGVTGISLNRTSATIGVGNTTQLTANVSPSNATNKSVAWSSSNTNVATVSSGGQVTGVGVGTVTIVCKSTDGTGVTASCTVTVANVSGASNTAGSGNSSSARPSSATNTNAMSQGVKQSSAAVEGESAKNDEAPEDTGEITELPEEEFDRAVEDIFTSDEQEGVKYDVTSMLRMRLSQSKRKAPLTVSWSAVKGFTGYEVFIATQNRKGDEITDSDYVKVGDVTGSYYEIVNTESGKTYCVKLRTYMVDIENGSIEYSDFTSPVKLKTKRKGLFNAISEWFVKIY